MTMNPKLHFRRFEFKYLVTQEEEAEIKKYIQRYVELDPYARATPQGKYEVWSLYYDSPFFYHYWEKVDGALQRKKIRLRTYKNAGEFVPYVFFEIKRKSDAIVLKDRFLLSYDDYSHLVHDEDFDGTRGVRSDDELKVIEEFERERSLRSIAPKMLVVYEREPYQGKYNVHFRITFDKNIRAMENDNLFYTGNDFMDVSGNWTVMELKYNGTLPFYINEVIKRFNLNRIAYSKYTGGVDANGSLSVFQPPYYCQIYDQLRSTHI